MSGPAERLRSSPASISPARERLWIALVVVLAMLLTFYRLGQGSLWDQDETKYAQVAREILQTGDPITLHVNGRPWYVHPPLYMWLVALTGRVFGFTEFTVRVWSAAFSVLTVYATMRLGRLWFGPRAGVFAGVILAVTFHFLVQSRLAVFDTVLLAWMLLAVYSFARAYGRGGREDYLRFFLFAGLATLTKGPIGLLLPALTIVPFVTIRRAWRRWREVPWTAGLALYAAVGLSWYAAEAWLHGRTFVASVLGYYGVGRFFGVVENQAGPWYYYVPVVLLGGIPWTAFWPAAAAYHLRRRRDHDGSLFVLLWCAITFVFYSAAGTKLPNYVLPIYPIAAVGVAAFWDRALRSTKEPAGISPEPSGGAHAIGMSVWVLAALIAALSVGIAGYLRRLYPDPFHTFGHVLVVPAAAFAIGGFAVLVITAGFHRPLVGFVALCATMAVTWVGVLAAVVPVVEAQKPMKPLALAIRSALQPGDRIVGYRLSIYSSLIFYTDHPVEWVDAPDALRQAVCGPGRVFVVITSQGWEAVRRILRVPLELYAERGGTRVFLKPNQKACSGATGMMPPRSIRATVGRIRAASSRVYT